MGALRLEPRRLDHPDALALIADVQLEYVARYGSPDESPVDPGMFDPPGGQFFVGYDAGAPVAMGGWKSRPGLHALGGVRPAEVKRMYVVPAGRGHGHARAVLAHLEATAFAAGADVMVLETGTAQPEAMALYESSGYLQIEKFGHYAWSPQSRCYGKRL